MTPLRPHHTLHWILALLLLVSSLQGAFSQASADVTTLQSALPAEPMISAKGGTGAEAILRQILSRFPDSSLVQAPAPARPPVTALAAAAFLRSVPGAARSAFPSPVACRAPPSF